jgi:glycosyltransferase involved in cell wall biosynthesis
VTESATPLVSCIMPTRNRRRFIKQAISYFLRQDYPRKELIILDDGEDSVADLIPVDEQICYARLHQKLLLGAKRNLGCKMSRGALIAHWDDDDWMAAHRLSAQVEHLRRKDAKVCGARELLFYSPAAGEAWLYSYPHDSRMWLAGGTLLYQRSAWEACPFPEISMGEDDAFIWQLDSKILSAMPDKSFYVALIHPGNTCGKNLADARWQRRPLSEISRLFGVDAEFYVALRNGGSVPVKARDCFYGEPCLVPPEAGAGTKPERKDALRICTKMAANLPLVSCIMPTRNRRAFLSQAIQYFKRQSYPHRELIIVDDGSEKVCDLIPSDFSIRYIHLPEVKSIGAKRNRACEIAKGEIIILWDDDDWYSHDRIAYQAAPLVADTADISGLDNSLFYCLPTRQFWRATSELHARMFYQGIVGGTLAFRKSLWDKGQRFPDISEREDSGFLEAAIGKGARLERLFNDGVFVYVRHNANTWQFAPGSFLDCEGWHQIAPPHFISGQDAEFYDIPQKSVIGYSGKIKNDSSSQPLVSCILATGNRKPFLKQAIKYFQNQTYQNKELIIVDDGPDPAEALVPRDPCIKYMRLESHINLGRKLNIGIENSSGGIIQKLDDDDYYHPKFLDTTVNAILDRDPEKFIVAFDCFLVLILSTGELKFSGHGWFAGQTLCFHRQLWEKGPFRDLPRAIDEWFLIDHPVEHIKIEDPELFITVRHEGGHLWTDLGQTDVTGYFRRQPNYHKSLAECLSAKDLSFYERLRQESFGCRKDRYRDRGAAGIGSPAAATQFEVEPSGGESFTIAPGIKSSSGVAGLPADLPDMLER